MIYNLKNFRKKQNVFYVTDVQDICEAIYVRKWAGYHIVFDLDKKINLRACDSNLYQSIEEAKGK